MGVVGLGNMGSELATNLVSAGLTVIAHDIAGSAGCPEGASFNADLDELALQAPVVVLSLPDAEASEIVTNQLTEASGTTVTHVVDTSTTGVHAARSAASRLRERGVAYVDGPVSGGAKGARARTLMVMVAAPEAVVEEVSFVLHALSDRVRHVGDEAGMGQALKLANNFLSATALAATSEAVAFGVSMGLDMATMLEVLNASSGQSAASRDKFVDHVLPGSYSSGFVNTLMAKDVDLYLEAVESLGGAAEFGALTNELWQRFSRAEPGADFTRVYPYTAATADGPRPEADS